MARSGNAVRFGLNPRGLPYDRIVEVAKAAEAAGFATLAFSDRPPEENLEGWTLATAIAVQTSRIRVTHSTLNVPFRNPALLSKMATALDAATSGGRLILTLGAGGQEEHFTSYGIPFGSPGERVDGLRDAIEILRGTWANERFAYEGKVYGVRDAAVKPKPVEGTIPIFIGAAQPRMLRLTGELADGWIRNGGWPSDLDAYRAQLAAVEAAAEAAGRDPAALRRVVNCNAYVGDEDPATKLATTFGNSGGVMGTAEQALEIVARYREAGVDTFHVQFQNEVIAEQIPAFGEMVIAKAE